MDNNMEDEFRREILGVMHPGHQATMELDLEYFAALKNHVLYVDNLKKGRRYPEAGDGVRHHRRLADTGQDAWRKGPCPASSSSGGNAAGVFEAVTVVAIPGGVPVVWHGAAMVKDEMEALRLRYEERYSGGRKLEQQSGEN